MPGRIAILGLGDLGRRLATAIAMSGLTDELLVVGRPTDGEFFAALLEACGTAFVRFVELDLSQQNRVVGFLRTERPDLVVQCACLISPWYLKEFNSKAVMLIRKAGFAAQLPAQLPLISTLMAAAADADFRAPIVNCSYPDVTNAVLGRVGLAPTVGVGNVGMICFRARAALRRELARSERVPGAIPLVRVLAHHAQLGPVIRAKEPEIPGQGPLIFLGDEGQRADDLAYQGVPLPTTRELNSLACASALEIVKALMPGGNSVRTSAPGPLGLPGGYPVVIRREGIELDLPDSLTLDECLAWHCRSAIIDGIAAIEGDGTVVYTDDARTKLAEVDPALAEPLRYGDAESRFLRLRRHIA